MQFIIALIAGLPGLLTAISAFYHSFSTKQQLKAQGVLR